MVHEAYQIAKGYLPAAKSKNRLPRDVRSFACKNTEIPEDLARKLPRYPKRACRVDWQAGRQGTGAVPPDHAPRRGRAARQQAEDAARALQAQFYKALGHAKSLSGETAAIEAALARQMDAAAHGDAIEAVVRLVRGRRLVYVGGRPGSNRTIRSLVQAAGGELVVPDGGVEDRKGLLAAALPGADLVVFPVDCIDHDSMGMLKRVCDRHGVAAPPQVTVSRFCLKHG